MTLEEDLGRQLAARAASVKATPDFGDLAGRIRTRDRRSARRERLALSAAMVVLAGSVGGLVGALANSPKLRPGHSASVGFKNIGGNSPSGKGPTITVPPPALHLVQAPRTVFSRQLSNGMSVTAAVQPLTTPVAISGAFSSSMQCANAELVTTTIGQSGSFGGGTSVARLPSLGSDGLEILSSGVLQVSGGGQVWWVTVSVGSAVARVAAENVGGSVFAATPSDGVAVVAGSVAGPNAASGEMSAVAEAASGQPVESLGFVLGSGPSLVGGSFVTASLPGCSALKLHPQSPSASSSQPADPALAAASVIGAFEQAYSPNALLGFAANLAAVSDGAQLAAPVTPHKGDGAKPLMSTRGGFGSPASSVPSSSAASSAAAAAASRVATNGGSVVEVQQVLFTSATAAEVVYRINGGVLLTGEAQLGSAGIWRVGLPTFCGDIQAGAVANVPTGVESSCEARA